MRGYGFVGGLHGGVLRRELRLRLIAILLWRDAAIVQRLLTLCRDASEIPVRFALREIRLRLFDGGLRLFDRGVGLLNLLIEFRRIDFGEVLTGPHAVAEVREAPFQISVRAGQNRSFRNRLHRARQHERGFARPARHVDHFHARDLPVLRISLGAERRLALLQWQVAGQKGCDQHDRGAREQRRHAFARRPTDAWAALARV